jgi:hypothetical protein
VEIFKFDRHLTEIFVLVIVTELSHYDRTGPCWSRVKCPVDSINGLHFCHRPFCDITNDRNMVFWVTDKMSSDHGGVKLTFYTIKSRVV